MFVLSEAWLHFTASSSDDMNIMRFKVQLLSANCCQQTVVILFCNRQVHVQEDLFKTLMSEHAHQLLNEMSTHHNVSAFRCD